ncbi:MAG: thioredoxin domain-containing protein [Gemmatimonadota bacterium]
MGGNLLAAEQSPYLRQHSDNPVAWQPWGDAAFAAASRLDRPVFLSIGYATCHWCHVMAHESFEDEAVADRLNRDFVSIKVDREERPDVDSVYMTVCQMMAGHGGWPLTAILTPDREPFFVTTYIPRESARGRIGMLDLLPRIAELWAGRRGDVERSATEIVEALRLATRVIPGSAPGTAELDTAARSLIGGFDPRFGGFTPPPKFPSPHNLTFLLRAWDRNGDADVLDMVVATLDAMRRGGIHDQLGGGFHRYSTDAEWRLPHFEKMLYDQALMAFAYLEAWTATGAERFAWVVRSTLDYVLSDLADPGGGFYSAEDADSEGEEGKFYVWTESQLAALLPDDADFELAIETFGVEPEGNFREEATGRRPGANVLVLAEDAVEQAIGHGGSPTSVQDRLGSIRHRMLDARCLRERPGLDDKVLTDWNGLMIAALARAGSALGEPEYVNAACRCADFLLQNVRGPDGHMLHRWREGEAAIPAMADDLAFLAWGLVELYGATFEPAWLDRAIALVDELLTEFEAPDGGLFGTSNDADTTLVRVVHSADGAIPSANSVAAAVLVRLAHLTGRSEYEAAANRILEGLGGRVASAPTAHTALLHAVDRLEGGALQVVIAGAATDPSVQRMLALARRRFLPRVALLFKPVGDTSTCEHLARIAPFTEAMTAPKGTGMAYICLGHACDRPITGAQAFEEALNRATGRPPPFDDDRLHS